MTALRRYRVTRRESEIQPTFPTGMEAGVPLLELCIGKGEK